MSRIRHFSAPPLTDCHESMSVGPAATGGGDYRSLARDFFAKVDGEACRAVAGYWLARYESEGGIPVYDRNVLIDLSAHAQMLDVRERLPATTRVRYRYVGQELTELFGAEMTGREITEFNGSSPEDSWARNRFLFDLGCPNAAVINFGMRQRRFIRIAFVAFPMRDAEGDIRFSLDAGHVLR